jgi:NAD(P)-dependent dehydrogenase (short-subunit alcohol dehydrogenase family)
MQKRFKDKVALITGAGTGIGRTTAQMFADEGATVVVADWAVEPGEETVHMIQKAGGEATFVKADVSQAAEVEHMVNTAVERYGRLDCAHNNAGVAAIRAPIAECTEDDWNRVVDINLKGVWLCMKYEIPQMLKQGGGAIVNTSSVAGLTALSNIPAYVASKHGVTGLTKAGALEYAKAGIRVNAVCPGTILTPFVEWRINGDPKTEARLKGAQLVERMGTPEEVANAVLWLCSEEASFVIGHAMIVDGGMALKIAFG